ncbi:MAG TPA: hypothetical protein VF006_01010 [Longimicrobium sp.]
MHAPPAEPFIVPALLPSSTDPVEAEAGVAEDAWAEYRLPSLAEMVLAFSGFDGGGVRGEDEDDEMAYDGVEMEALRLELPVELQVDVDDDGRPRIGLAPPTQTTETTILPVFHRMTIAIERDGSRG